MSIRLFVEGGGDGKDTKSECRRAFARLLEKVGLQGRMPRVVAGGSRAQAFSDFRTALGDTTIQAMLLVDREASVTATSAWQHLRERPGDGWQRPENATDDQCQLMVQAMESWLVADGQALVRFFGQHFQRTAIPAWSDVEPVLKADVLERLTHASRNCARQYHKGPLSFQLLAEVEPTLVRKASKWAERFFATIDRMTKAAHAG